MGTLPRFPRLQVTLPAEHCKLHVQQQWRPAGAFGTTGERNASKHRAALQATPCVPRRTTRHSSRWEGAPLSKQLVDLALDVHAPALQQPKNGEAHAMGPGALEAGARDEQRTEAALRRTRPASPSQPLTSLPASVLSTVSLALRVRLSSTASLAAPGGRRQPAGRGCTQGLPRHAEHAEAAACRTALRAAGHARRPYPFSCCPSPPESAMSCR